MLKYWRDKKKERHDQRRKGFKPPSIEIAQTKIGNIILVRMKQRNNTPWEK
jgi:hypothetical protein